MADTLDTPEALIASWRNEADKLCPRNSRRIGVDAHIAADIRHRADQLEASLSRSGAAERPDVDEPHTGDDDLLDEIAAAHTELERAIDEDDDQFGPDAREAVSTVMEALDKAQALRVAELKAGAAERSAQEPEKVYKTKAQRFEKVLAYLCDVHGSLRVPSIVLDAACGPMDTLFDEARAEYVLLSPKPHWMREPSPASAHPSSAEGVTFDELRRVNVLRCETAFHSINAWAPWEWSNAMAGECGEACNVTKKMNRIWPANQFKQCWNKPEDQRMADLEDKLADEIADVVIYADLLAARIGRSLADCVVRKFNSKSDEIGSAIKLLPPAVLDPALRSREKE